LVLVLDASGSMWGQVQGEAKIVGARRVVGDLSTTLGADQQLALVAYGHRREGDCADIETVVPLGAPDQVHLRKVLEALNPKGKTPITAAVEHALGVASPGATVVVVTDGLETCGGDPCAAVRRARAAGGNFRLHVVGLDVGKEDVSSLECAAQAGGGLYWPAADARELGLALGALVSPEPAPAGALVVRATRNGELQDVAVKIKPSAGGPELGARTYQRAETNPRTIPLADGRHQVRVAAVGIEGAPERSFEIEITNGATVERTVDYSTGVVSLAVTRNGALSDVTYQLFAPGDRKRAVVTGRTYRSASHNPVRETVVVGEYDVVLHALEIGGRPVVDLGRVVVSAGETTALTHNLVSGDLIVGAMRGAELVDATVSVRAAGKSVDASRTYKAPTSNPTRFALSPGEYEVELREIRGVTRRFVVSVVAGGSHEHTVDFAQPEG
jgi:Ca-activated chloride channel family protein